MVTLQNNKYHYIITGAGAAGLSLLMHFIESGKFSDKKILLVDRSNKTDNDRTWCFWETKPGIFQPIVHKQWDAVYFHSDDVSRLLDIAPYRYKMIRGIDFYNYCLNVIGKQSNIEILQANVDTIDYEETSIESNGRKYYADYIFNSILFEKPVLKGNQFYLKQHFKGWIVDTGKPVFDAAHATLMDFRVSQQHGTTFTYVLPLSETTAMVEYTLFSADLLKPQEYNEGLRDYMNRFVTSNYTIREEETGVIPMTNYAFSTIKNNVVNIGSAGGQTKPSSGYTFYFIQRHSRALTNALLSTGKPFIAPLTSKRFSYYDSVLLNVLATNKLPGKQVFTDLFRRNKPVHILQFLNNESPLSTDLKIIASLPTMPFLRAGLQQLLP